MPLANNLTEVSSFDSVVGQLETTTAALGGPGAPMNEQAQALANRTRWLKDHISKGAGGVNELLTNTSIGVTDLNKAFFIDASVTTQITVGLPSGHLCEDGDMAYFKHVAGGSGSMEITTTGGDDFMPASGSWFLLTPGDYVIFVLKKGAVNASLWLPVAHYNYVAPTPTAWVTHTVASGDVTPSGGDTIASGFTSKFRYRKVPGENILHFRFICSFVSTGLSVTGLAVDLSAVFTTPAAGMYVHLGSGQCSGYSISSLINASQSTLNITSSANQTLAQGSNVVTVALEGHIEVN